jgi:hypothetical protein
VSIALNSLEQRVTLLGFNKDKSSAVKDARNRSLGLPFKAFCLSNDDAHLKIHKWLMSRSIDGETAKRIVKDILASIVEMLEDKFEPE